MHMKQKSVYQQTQALLCKNLLKKWRMKRENLLEWGFPILLAIHMCILSHFNENVHFPGMPPQNLGRVDKYNRSFMDVVYTPVSNLTQQIMNKTAFAPVMKGRRIIGAPDEKSMDEIMLDTFSYSVGVIFNDSFSYKLKFYRRYYVPILKEDFFTAYCQRTNINDSSCALERYWKGGFVPLQAAINAAIIQTTANHYVIEELMSVTAVNMKTPPFIFKENLQNEMFIFYCLLYFSPFLYFLSLNVTRERKKYKDLMNLMGLQDSAFWLSWGLIYAAFIFVASVIITVIITSTEIIILTGFTVIFTLFFLYGLSLIALAFLMTVLLKKTFLTSLLVFLLTLFWGSVGFTAFYQQLPSPLKWIFSICSAFAFSAGINQIIHLDYTMNGVIFPDASGDSYIMIATFSMLTFDALLYLVLALYFDKILPYGNESHYSPLFFLNSSSCIQHRRTGRHVAEKDADPEPPSDEHCEPVAPEFQGREAVRIRNVKKVYKEKTGKVEVLKGLCFDIYEGQITAILGHSGAGKSALLRVLSGSSIPTEGSVTIYNKNLSEMQDLEEIQKITGVCPQFNVQFDTLTVKENLRLFAKIKGIQPKDVEQEVQRVLLELDIQDIQDNLATLLSEGQKRKLTIGIALLGDPQVLLLDEPTAGLDPFSRHRVWNFLRERKAGRVILLSTNLTDEADILADRKVILSNGRLKCAGSSVFLKRRWGLGYHLSLYRNETCDPEKITSLINHHIPDAKLKTESKEKLVYTLPAERTNKFPGLFSDLDEGCSLGVMSYEVSTSTLNEVVTKLEGDSMAEQDFEQAEMSTDTGRLHEMDPPCPSAPETQKAVSVAGLWRLQFWAMARLRFLQLRRGKKGLLTLLFVFGVAVFPLIVESIFYAVLNETTDWEFKPELYFLSPGQLPQDPRTSLLIINNTESNIEDFIQSLKHQNILLEVDDFENRNGTEDPSYNGAIIVSGKLKDYRFSVVCNTKRLHCFPVLVSVVSNALLRMFNQTRHIRTERSAYPLGHTLLQTGLPQGSFFLFFVTCSLSPYIAMSSVSDYKKRTKSQLWISGLFPSAYWCGQALVDVSLYGLILLSMYLIFYLANMAYIYLTSRVIFALVVMALGYAASLVFLTYVIAFIFRKRRKNSGLWSFCFYVVTAIAFGIIMLFAPDVPVLITCMTLVPSATLSGFIAFLQQRISQYWIKYQEANYDLSAADFLVCLIPYFQALLFMFVLRCLEAKCGKKIMQKDPVFRISPQSRDARSNTEEPVAEDEDVQAERIRTATALNTSIEEKPVIIASCLHKEYAGQKKRCFSRRRKKTAVRNISFCVKKGEILGLLGPSGAGKSSSVRMISGVMTPTAGEVELTGYGSDPDQQGDASIRFLGYCPQENVLWPSLTTRDHLEVFAAVKGLQRADARVAISRLVDAFKLHEQLNVPVQKLPGGAARKLCFVLSLLGDPPILLLDEPSTGLDPAEQKQLWQTIQRAVRNTARGALLSTHSVAEAEAVCDRMAIMVSGRLRCIGSIQHLKNSLGKDYILELKLKEASQGLSVHTEVLRLFPQAAQQARYSSFSAYRLPVQDAQPLSQAFHKLETVKRNFNLEEYSLSQCTLEKVFIELSKEQELGNVDEEHRSLGLARCWADPDIQVAQRTRGDPWMNCFWSLAPAFLRVRMSKRHFSVGQQTRALLGKNFLKKWRMKREALSEWLFSCLPVLFAHLFSSNLHQVNDFPQLPSVDLGRVDNFNDSDYVIAFAPESKTTQEIMNKLASAPFIKGRPISGWPDEQSMGELELNYSTDAVRVIFNDAFSYHLKFLWGHRIPTMKEHRDHSAHCQVMDESVMCEGSLFWEEGFVAFQAAINAAIIEITTNHSVMDKLMSVTGVNMKILPFVAQAGVMTDVFIFFCVISFSAFIYYVSVSVTQERQFMKPVMTVMGLRESAFWLSWGLMYTGFISVTATLMALVVAYAPVVVLTGFTVVFTLFLLYGLSLIALAFLTSVLVKKPFLTGLVVFLLTVFWGSLGFTALYRQLPAALEWVLCLLSPFAFTAGMAQLIHLDYDVNSNIHSDSPNDQYLIIATIFMLAFDALLYLVLTLYLDKILPTEYGRQQPPWFFLKPSSWFQRRRADRAALENDIDPESPPNDSFEPVSPEFHGKEAIRIRNLKKTYGKGKHEKVEALKGLVLDIYEGQITGILGHSGAGKTTLLNILSGLSAPTSGSVTIYNHSLSEAADLEYISKLTGFCPQANVQFGFLTVRENLRLFAKIKGIQPHEVELQVQRVLQDLEMGNIQDVLAQNLSGGQRRKLTFGTAILGDPRVLLLDEPTAGSDPLSRHRVWNLLRERKSDHMVLFSTPFMDEADVLADRKVFMSNGRLKCAGSSLFLKRKWGIGYHLSLHLNETCDPDSVTSIVKHHIPDAKLTAQSEEKLAYILPLERTNKFPDLYRDLESCSNQGIENYGVSMTTLNEVFLKLEGISTIDESGPGVREQLQSGRPNATGSLVEPEQVVSSFSEANSSVSGLALWRQQLCAVAKVRFLKLKSEKRALLAILLLFGITFGPQLLEHVSYRLHQKSYSWGLSPNMYFLSPGQPPRAPLTRLLVINRTGSSIDDFIHSLRHQNIDLEVDAFGTRNGPNESSYNGAVTVTGDDKDPRFSIACNTKRLNCFPVLMDIISNGLLGMLNSSEHIQTDRSTYFEEHTSYEHGHLGLAFFWIPGAACFTPHIAMGSIGDSQKRVHSQLRISGLYPSAYWFGQALVDVPLYLSILFLMQTMDYIFSPEEFVFIIQNLAVQTLCIIGYVSSLVFLTYVISFIFRHGRKNSGIWSFFFLLATLFAIVANYLNEYGFLGLFLCTILIPPFTLIGVLLIFSEISPDSVDYLGASEQQVAFLTLLIPYLHFFIFLIILRCLEMKFRKKPMRKDPVFRISPRSSAVFANPEKPEGEDEDVQMERRRTADAVTAPDSEEKPAIVASCLRKEYAGRKKNCFAKRKKKVAIRNVSFCVKKGEVIGLLGHNGAGKSTTIRMITGDARPTAGQVLLAGGSGGAPPGFLGYCPQESALWPSLTVREHLEVSAAVKGLRRADAAAAIARLADTLKLQDQMALPAKALPEGAKRKLSFALSVLGSPAVLLLDEPTTGMDPEGQLQMWQLIRASSRNAARGALLSTHSAAEAEAVCDRVAVVVSGSLRCVGSIQQLKSKFCRDYLLEMKLKSLEQLEALHGAVLRIFPQAARQQRFASLVVYKLPVEEVHPLSHAFFSLETVKQNFDLEEYSLSQCSLEQVFLELCKEQEWDNSDEEVDLSVKWKLLQEEP